MEEPSFLYKGGVTTSGKETEKGESNYCRKIKNSSCTEDALKKEMTPKVEGNSSPISPVTLRKKLSIAMNAGRFSNLSTGKTKKGYPPHSDSGYIQESGVSYGRSINNHVKENDMKKSNHWLKHDKKRKMMLNASPRSPMILRKKPSIAMSPRRSINSSNSKREKGYSRPTEDNVSYERSISDIAKEKDKKQSVHQSHVKKSPSAKDGCVDEKMKHKTKGSPRARASMILRKMQSITVARQLQNLSIQKKENKHYSCRGNFHSSGYSPYGDSGMSCTGKPMCLRCSELTRKSSSSQRQFCLCNNTEVADELAASFEDLEGHQMKTSYSNETSQIDGTYELCVKCKQPGSLVFESVD